jgi:DNA-directed RNA polymerase subunit RPC12/RpoP
MEEIKFFRCVLCTRVVSVWDIKTNHSCPKCGNNRIIETNLSGWEKIIQIIKHPLVWRWGKYAEGTYYDGQDEEE